MTSKPKSLCVLLIVLLITACGAPSVPTAVPIATPTALPVATLVVSTPMPVVAAPTSAPTATAASFSPVRFELQTSDAAPLSALAWPGSDTWVILASNGDGGQARWEPLAKALAVRGYSVLSFDWRGTTPGLKTPPDWTKAVLDAQAALAHARANGAKRLVLIGSSLGGITSIKLGDAKDVVAVVAIGTPYKAAPLEIDKFELLALAKPTLFIASRADTIVAANETTWLHEQAPSLKSLLLLDGGTHGVELLASPQREVVLQRLLEFVTISTAQESVTTINWRADVMALEQAIRRTHPKPFYKNNQAEFEQGIRKLYADIPHLKDVQIKVELMRLGAMFDAHTRVNFWQPAMDFNMYGLRLYQFSDGVHVVQAPNDPVVLGARVMAINNIPIADVLARVQPFVEHDNAAWLQYLAPTQALVPEILQAAGVLTDVKKPRFSLRLASGELVERNPAAISVASFRAQMSLFQLPQRGDPVWLSRRGEPFRFEQMQNGQTLYVQFNQVRYTNNGETLPNFVERMRSEGGLFTVRKVIVDLRNNGGGDNTTYGALLDVLRNKEVDQPGKVWLLVGRNTFSAAGTFATDVEQSTRAKFAGEDMGTSPNLYGDTRTTKLPHSGIEIWISARYHQHAKPDDRRDTISPSLKVPLTFDDWWQGRDPVLAAVLATTGSGP